MRLHAALGAVCALSVTACTTMPEVTASYRHPRADLALTVTRTIGCSPLPAPPAPGAPAPPTRPRRLYTTTAVVPTISYSADTGADARESFNLAALDGPLSDSAISFEFYEDGRLKGVNTTTTGQGMAVIQAVANLVPLLAASSTDLGAEDRSIPPEDIDKICQEFDRISVDDKPVTIVYEVTEAFDIPTTGPGAATQIVAPMRLIPISPRSNDLTGSNTPINTLNATLPRLCVDFGTQADPVQPGQVATARRPRYPTQLDTGAAPDDSRGLPLRLRRPARFNVQVYRIGIEADANDQSCHTPTRTALWSGNPLIPLTAAASQRLFRNDGEYHLPVPRGAPFGGNSLKLGLAESGAIVALGYGNTSGTAGAITAAGTIGSAMIETDAERAARLASQGDLIAAQQRLIRCQQTPKDCE